MLEIKGKVNTAVCYAKIIEDGAVEQIRRMCDYALTEGSKIRIMPDVHAGKGCTIGTTMTIVDKACPNIVGVDIGVIPESSQKSPAGNNGSIADIFLRLFDDIKIRSRRYSCHAENIEPEHMVRWQDCHSHF